MRFKITGADKASGNERSIVVEADDEKAALDAGRLQGIFAYHAKVIPPLSPERQSRRVSDLEVEPPPIIQRSPEIADARPSDRSDRQEWMKRFLIVGADEDSGRERSVIVEAIDETTALREAKRQGIFPYRHEILPDADETTKESEGINPTPIRPLTVETIELDAFVSTAWRAAGFVVVLFLVWALFIRPKSPDSPSLTLPDSQREPASRSEPTIDTARVRSRLDYVRPYVRQQQRDAALLGWDTTNLRKLSLAVDAYEHEPTETNWRVVQSAADAYVQQHLQALTGDIQAERHQQLLRMFSDDQASTPFLDRQDASDYSSRVRVWAKQFGRSESWVRRYSSTSDSAENANIKLVRQWFLEGTTTPSDPIFDDQGSTPFLNSLDASNYSSRVSVWAKQFARSESWVRRYSSTSDSAENANIKLVRQWFLEEG